MLPDMMKSHTMTVTALSSVCAATAAVWTGISMYRYADTQRRNRRQLPPRVEGHWFWGNAVDFAANAVAFFQRCERDIGKVFYVRLLTQPLNVIMDAHAIEQFKREKAFDFGPIQRQVNGNVFGFELPDTKATIRAIAHDYRGFSLQRNAANFDTHMRRAHSRVTDSLLSGVTNSDVDADNDGTMPLRKFTEDTIWAAIFHSIFGEPVSQKDPWTSEACLEQFDLFHHYFNYLWAGVPHACFPEAGRALKFLCEAQCTPAQLNDESVRHGVADYMKRQTMEMEKNGRSASDIQGHNLVYLHVHFNSFRLMYWFMAFIASRPEVVVALQEEINELVEKKRATAGNDSSRQVTFDMDDIDSLVLLDSAFKETLRLVSGVFMVRQIQKDTKFTTSDGTEYLMPKGEKVAIYPPALHYDEEVFENAEQFQFDRFLPDAQFFKNGRELRNPLVGFGTICVGQRYGTFISKWFALTTLARYHVSLADLEAGPPNVDVRYYGHEVLPPAHDVRVHVTPRKDDSAAEIVFEGGDLPTDDMDSGIVDEKMIDEVAAKISQRVIF